MKNRIAKSETALGRISLAETRIRSILERETVAHQKTLEQKISDQGPDEMRVDPHLVGLALMDLTEREILSEHKFRNTTNWYAHRLERPEKVAEFGDKKSKLYAYVSSGNFPNLVGDALELITEKSISVSMNNNRALTYFGSFRFDLAQDKNGRYKKTQPPKTIGNRTTNKEADFIIAGHPDGPIAVECKNIREWLYPNSRLIKELILKSYELGAHPLLVHRRIHYTTIQNFFRPAGIMSHESYFQYYPANQTALAEEVRHKRSLGFTDVRASEEPNSRTVNFFCQHLPSIAPSMAAKWEANKDSLYEFACGGMNIAQIYNAIGSQAGGKWVEPDDSSPDPEDYYSGYD